MPNNIKFTAENITGTLKKGNARFSTRSSLLGPTHATKLYNCIIPPVNGYTFYMPKSESVVEDGLTFAIDPNNYSSYRTGYDLVWDISYNQNDGVLYNGVTFDSVDGGSFVFDGVDDVVEIHNISNLFTGDYTIFIFVKLDNLTSTSAILDHGAKNSVRFYTISGKIRITHTGAFSNPGVESTSNYTSGWQCWAVTVDGTTLEASLYLNGTFNNSGTLDNAAGSYDYFAFGDHPLGDGSAISPLLGKIGTSLVYGRKLSGVEIQQNYDALKTRYGL